MTVLLPSHDSSRFKKGYTSCEGKATYKNRERERFQEVVQKSGIGHVGACKQEVTHRSLTLKSSVSDRQPEFGSGQVWRPTEGYNLVASSSTKEW